MSRDKTSELRGEFFPLLNAFGEAQWQSGRGVHHADIHELGEAVFSLVSRLQSRLEELEIDAARIKLLTTIEDSGEGLRFELNCIVNNGVNTFKVWDEQKSDFIDGDWCLDPINAIDAAMQSTKEQK